MLSYAARSTFARWTLKANVGLIFNAGSLALSAAGAAVIGFLFWWLAARTYPADRLGIASAGISAMNLLGLVGDLGLGTFLMAAIQRTDRVGALISTSLLAAGVSSACLAGVFALLAGRISPELAAFTEGPLRAASFVAGVSITGVVLVLDQALVGIMHASLQLARNLCASVVKVALLVAVIQLGRNDAFDIFLAWVLGSAVSTILVLSICARQGSPIVAKPDRRMLRGMGATILGHHSLNLATQVVGLLLPLVVTAMISASANAAFFAAWMIVQVWCLGPAALATVLFPVATKEPHRLAQLMRLTLLLWLFSIKQPIINDDCC